MLKGESIVCGTTTTGTGTLTLAATPVAPGGIDLDVLARATGIGLANSAAIIVPYTIVEYTSSGFTTAKKTEKGWGLLTLGGSSGIANCTLARTTPQVTATSLDSQPATYNTNAPTAVSIGTAANVLVFVGPSAADVFTSSPYYETTIGDALGIHGLSGSQGVLGATLTNGTELFRLVYMEVPMLAKKASMRVVAAYTGGTTNAYARIYAQEQVNGRPGKLLIDFGLLGSAGTSLNSANTNISSAVHTTGYYLTPGWYWVNFFPSFSGGSGSPTISGEGNLNACIGSGRGGSTSLSDYVGFSATGGTATPAPDTANTTSWTGLTSASAAIRMLVNPS